MYEDLRDYTAAELAGFIGRHADAPPPVLLSEAAALCGKAYGRRVFFRGLVEFSNHCKNDCYYCGLRAGNRALHRYRMAPNEIIDSIGRGYAAGFRSFVLQSGEDAHYNAGRMVDVVAEIKARYANASLTLSIGELPKAMYKRLREAGAERYLLRHETADDAHYARLHPEGMTLAARKRRLYDLKDVGFQVGAGFMVGSPGQTVESLAKDMLFLRELQPEMVGIGPFLPQSATPFAKQPPGALNLTLLMVAIVRMTLPNAMLPATTALGTLANGGREMGLCAGANVVMPNITPLAYRKDYVLYDGKAITDDGIEDGVMKIAESVRRAGFAPDFSRGDPVILA